MSSASFDIESLNGSKVETARRVFGDVALGAEDEVASLTYSVSPIKNSTRSSNESMVSESSNNYCPGTPESASTFRSQGPFDGILTPVAEKENYSRRREAESPTKPMSIVREKARQTRLQVRSPLGRDLVQKAQKAIQKASRSIRQASVNPAIAKAQRSKQANLRSNQSRTGLDRENWQEDKRRAQETNKSAEQQRRELLNLKVALMSQNSQERAALHLKNRHENIHNLDAEAKYNSSVYRDHQESLKIAADARRRASVQAKQKVRANNRKGRAAMEMARIQEDRTLMEERQESSRARVRFNIRENSTRRASYQFRAGDAKRIREIHQRLEAERKEREHQSYQLESLGHKDADAYRKLCANQRRESFINRGKDSVDQRMRTEDTKTAQLAQEQTSLQLKRDGDKDAEDYKRHCEAERRKSLVNRGRDTVRGRERTARLESERLAEEQTSLQLKREANKDAEAYHRRLEAERRESLENRNKERARRAQVMQELASIAQQKESESLALEFAGDRDAQAYLQRLASERRKSLQFRGRENVRQRAFEQDEHAQRIQSQHEDEELRSKDSKNVQAYKKECAERDRASLEHRHKDAYKARVKTEASRIRQQLEEANNFELETQARADVQDYLKNCKNRRRLSLAFRAKEQRRHWRIRHEQHARRVNEESQQARDRVANAQAVELARQLEVTQAAIDALRHSVRNKR